MVEAEIEAKEQSVAKKIRLENIDQNDDKDELSGKIKQQLDYYFSDVNIIKDKFLLGEIKKDDGWVKLSVLLTFSRLQQLTKDENRIVEALLKLKSDIIELDDSKKRIRRKNKLPNVDEFKKDLDLRTVHISGFPTDYSFENLRTFCSQFGEVESVAMRRHFKTRLFKGCIHVVYKRVEDAKKTLITDPLNCKDRELRSESMEQYYKRKAEMAEKRMENRKKRRDGGDSKEKDRKANSNESETQVEPDQKAKEDPKEQAINSETEGGAEDPVNNKTNKEESDKEQDGSKKDDDSKED